jgi:O-antigen ligase
MAMLLFLATQFGHRKKAITLVRTGYICLLAATLYLTQSRSGWVVAIGLWAIMELLRKIARFKLRDRTIGYAIAACLIATSAAVLLTNAGSLLQALGRDATLSGRTDIWNAVWNSIMQRPLLGYGYAAFWRGLQGASADIILELGWAVPHAHSGILDLWLQLGLVGVIIFAASLVLAVKDMATCLRADRPGCVDWYVATVALVIMFSMTESLLLSDQSLSWLLYVLACLGLQKTAKQMRSGGTWRERISE